MRQRDVGFHRRVRDIAIDRLFDAGNVLRLIGVAEKVASNVVGGIGANKQRDGADCGDGERIEAPHETKKAFGHETVSELRRQGQPSSSDLIAAKTDRNMSVVRRPVLVL